MVFRTSNEIIDVNKLIVDIDDSFNSNEKLPMQGFTMKLENRDTCTVLFFKSLLGEEKKSFETLCLYPSTSTSISTNITSYKDLKDKIIVSIQYCTTVDPQFIKEESDTQITTIDGRILKKEDLSVATLVVKDKDSNTEYKIQLIGNKTFLPLWSYTKYVLDSMLASKERALKATKDVH